MSQFAFPGLFSITMQGSPYLGDLQRYLKTWLSASSSSNIIVRIVAAFGRPTVLGMVSLALDSFSFLSLIEIGPGRAPHSGFWRPSRRPSGES